MAFRAFVIALIAFAALAGGAEHRADGDARPAIVKDAGEPPVVWLGAIFVAFGAAEAIRPRRRAGARPL